MTVKFDWTTFQNTEYNARTAEVVLKNFGGDPENETVFTVRGLDAIEMAKIRESVENNRDMSGLLEKISDSMSGKEKLNIVSEIMGIVKDKTPDLLIRQYVAFELGIIDPKPGSRADVIKFARCFPIEFNQLCSKIFELTGMGFISKKKLNNSIETSPQI